MNFSAELERAAKALERAEAVVIGAGSGLSASAGLTYGGPRFQEHFADFIARYHFTDMYWAGFYPYPTQEEYWAYWSRHIWWNRYAQDGGEVYGRLLGLVGRKDYFVLTTNVDHCFQRAGADKSRLFYTQGDYGLFQCAKPCHDRTYDNKETVRRMVEEQRDLRIPVGLAPTCPVCGGPMIPNLRCDGRFVEDEGWRAAQGRYGDFLRRHMGDRVVFLELGVGNNTPGIIKYPFWRMTAENRSALYVCVNQGKARAPEAIRARSVCLDGDIGAVLEKLGELACLE